jgi:hypothetical protein
MLWFNRSSFTTQDSFKAYTAGNITIIYISGQAVSQERRKLDKLSGTQFHDATMIGAERENSESLILFIFSRFCYSATQLFKRFLP